MQLARTISPDFEITSGQRRIRDGKQYDRYFPKPDERDRIIIKDGEVSDTVELMEKVVHKYLTDTARIAPVLRRKTLEQTCQSIYNFVYNNIQYKLDKRGLEQLRRPARSWAERRTGVDCDCMSIFVSSILTNLKIPHSFRITRYSADHWQHVYVIVPDNRVGYINIDAVVSPYGYEKPFTDKMDYTMSLNGINVAVLSGLNSDLDTVVMGAGLSGSDLGATTAKQDLDSIYRHLVATRKSIAENPKMVSSIDDPQALIKMLDYAIEYFYTDKREEALAVLERNEDQLNLRNGFSGLGDDVFDHDEYALSGPGKKGFFKGIKKAVQKVGKGIKEAGKAVVRFNPVSIAARGGFLVAMKTNLGKMAAKLKWGYATREQAAAKGVSEAQWNKSKDALAKVERLFADKLQGKREALRNAILQGKAGNLNGIIEEDFQGLGEPVTAAAVAAATPIIVSTIKILKDAGLLGKNENINANDLAKEIANNSDAVEAMQRTGSESGTESGGGDAPPQKSSSTETEQAVAPGSSGGSGSGGGIMEFIKKNPIPAVVGGGLLAYGIYRMVSKPKKSSSLSGYSRRKKKKSQTKHSKGSKHLPMKAVKLL